MATFPTTESFAERSSVPLVGELQKEEKEYLYNKLGMYEKGYSIGVISFAVNMFFLFRFPQYYWIWHLGKAFVYIPWRFVRFKWKGWEWYLMDFCYFVTYATIIGCGFAFARIMTGFQSVLYEHNYAAMRAIFSYANGALLFAVPMFGNKIVFHDVDNTASLYIHLSPPLLSWTLRWGGGFGTSLIEETWGDMFMICRNMTEADVSVHDIKSALWYNGPCAGKLSEFMTYPLLGWIVFWGIPYYLVMFCCLKGYMERNPQKKWLFRDCLADTKGMFRYLKDLPVWLQPLGFMLLHMAWTAVAGFCSIALWNSFILHTLFLTCVFTYAVHNGSTYMFRVVATRNLQNVIKRSADKAATQYELVPTDAPAAP